MRSVWQWAQTDEEKRKQMPAILHMAVWLHDPQASASTGRTIFRLPYPGGTWYDEKRDNQLLLSLMDIAWRVAMLGVKVKVGGKKLSDEEEKLIDEIAEHL